MGFDGPARGSREDIQEALMASSTTNDLAAHERTYRGFLSLVKWGTGTVVVVLCLMGVFLVRH